MKNILSTIHAIVPHAVDIDWPAIYEQALPRIFHYFCYRVGDASLAEDLTASTFEKAWKNRSTFRPNRGTAHAWLMGIARHSANDHFQKKVREIPFETVPEIRQSPSLDEDLQRKLDFQILAKRLSQLPERERELVAMKYGAEMTNREIARLTGLSESNVGTILHRVVEKLRIEWEKDHER